MGSTCSKDSKAKGGGKEGDKKFTKLGEDSGEVQNTLKDGQDTTDEVYDDSAPAVMAMSSKRKKDKSTMLDNKKKYRSMEGLSSVTLSGTQSIAEIVKIPPGTSYETWIFVNCLEFAEEVKIIFDTISDTCQSECKEMTAGPHFTYLWTDEVNSSPLRVAAYEYVECLYGWIYNTLNSSDYSKTKDGVYPSDYQSTMSVLFKKLFRVYAHVYHHHLRAFLQMNAEAHLNTCFQHFIVFVREFSLVTKKEEIPLKKLIRKLLNEDSSELLPSSDPLTHPLTHSLTRQLSHSTTTTQPSSLIQPSSLSYSLTPSLTPSFTPSLTPSLTHSMSVIQPSVGSFDHSLNSDTHSLTHSPTHSLTHSTSVKSYATNQLSDSTVSTHDPTSLTHSLTHSSSKNTNSDRFHRDSDARVVDESRNAKKSKKGANGDAHLSTHSPTHSSTHSSTHPSTHSSTHSSTHPSSTTTTTTTTRQKRHSSEYESSYDSESYYSE